MAKNTTEYKATLDGYNTITIETQEGKFVSLCINVSVTEFEDAVNIKSELWRLMAIVVDETKGEHWMACVTCYTDLNHPSHMGKCCGSGSGMSGFRLNQTDNPEYTKIEGIWCKR